MTAVPNEWLLDGAQEAPSNTDQRIKVDPLPAAGLEPVSLSECGVEELFAGVWKVRRNGTHNLVLARKEPLLASKAEALNQGMGVVTVTRATIDDQRGGPVIFGGEDHVSIGTGGAVNKTVLDDKARAAQKAFYERRAAARIAAPGQGPDIFNIVAEWDDEMRFKHLASGLARAGWTSAQIEKALGGNLLRLYGETFG